MYNASKLLSSATKPNAYSLLHLVRASTDLGFDSYCRQLHTYILKSGFFTNVFVSTALLRFYSITESIIDADKAFDEIPQPNAVSWNTLISACVHSGQFGKAMYLFLQLERSGTCPDAYSFTLALSASAHLNMLQLGRSIHCEIVKYGLECATVVGNCLIDISFERCRWSCRFEMGMVIHCRATKGGWIHIVVGSSLDMYSKCGQVKNAESMFQLLPKRNIITWNAMISGYAYNGDSGKVIQQLRELKMVADLKPDGVTFLNVIAACSNTEVPLQQAIGYFESMINDYGIEPTIEHCCSMIRLMGQRGEGFKVANIAAAKVIELEGDDDYVYVMMSNIFASYGKWRDVSKGLSMAWNKRLHKIIVEVHNQSVCRMVLNEVDVPGGCHDLVCRIRELIQRDGK
ncbi:hypothetical protein GH714_009219 [Hevea brasiliensis]|uniref:Pentacotripeptide-repeat region of PRORP domain-containing protein n=1 Tax=Hevea brasiliensis TaxID=3981 RepID=A0A6A6MIH2_HEVBR|nr:hypothetical protein GH714_009219 [Hevea brasiliensis]